MLVGSVVNAIRILSLQKIAVNHITVKYVALKQIYVIEGNGQVLEPLDEYIAGGSGENFAIAVLSQNNKKPTVDRIKEALEAAEKHALGVKRPFYIMNTKSNEIITII